MFTIIFGNPSFDVEEIDDVSAQTTFILNAMYDIRKHITTLTMCILLQ